MCNNVAKVRQLVKSDRWLSTQIIAEEINLDRETVKNILIKYLEMRKIFVKTVPIIFIDEQT